MNAAEIQVETRAGCRLPNLSLQQGVGTEVQQGTRRLPHHDANSSSWQLQWHQGWILGCTVGQ